MTYVGTFRSFTRRKELIILHCRIAVVFSSHEGGVDDDNDNDDDDNDDGDGDENENDN